MPKNNIIAACAAAMAAWLLASPADAADQIKIGVTRLNTAGPAFIAKDKGFFAKEGIEAEIKIFGAASDIPVAVTSGDLEFGATGLTAAFYNLAGKGGLKIIGGQTREEKNYNLTAIMATNKGLENGLKSIKDLPGKRIGITTAGSTFHYMIGLLGEKFGFDPASVVLVPLQTTQNMSAAFIGQQVDGVLSPQTNVQPMLAANAGKVLGWVGDEVSWQVGAVFTSPDLIAKKRDLAVRFLRAWGEAVAAYNKAFNQLDANNKAIEGPGYAELLDIVAKGLALPPAQIKNFPLVSAKLDAKDIERQLKFWQTSNLVAKNVTPEMVMDASFAK